MNNLLKYYILIILIFIYGISYSQKQYAFNKKEIEQREIDTTELFHLENNGFDLFFSQKDIESVVLKYGNVYKWRKELLDTITTSKELIKLKLDTIYDKTYERKRGDAIGNGVFQSNLDKRDRLNYEIRDIIDELLLNGKFLIKKQRRNTYLKNNIYAKKVVGEWGTSTIYFYYKRKIFFNNVVVLGN